jgi:hypothetical protein
MSGLMFIDAYRRSHQATAVPDGVSLTLVGDDIDVHTRRLWNMGRD